MCSIAKFIGLLSLFYLSCNYTKKDSHVDILALEGIYTETQAKAGEEIYSKHCPVCHGTDLRGSEGGSALIGDRFINTWKDSTVFDLYSLTKNTMPKTNPNSLGDKAYTDLVAFILDKNQYTPGKKELSSKEKDLNHITIGNPLATNRTIMQFKPKPVESKPITIEADWRQHRGDYASTNYSPLDQINRNNVKNLKIAWRWKTDNFGPSPEFYFKATPLMANGKLYVTAGTNRTVASIDAITGETIWTYRHDETDRKAYVPRQNSGRGVAYYTSAINGKDRIVYITPGYQMISLDAYTGQLIPSFGTNGIVDLKKQLDTKADPGTITIGSTSPPIIINNVIILGSTFPVGLAPTSKKQVSGDIMGFDVITGKKLWTFHTIPHKGEEGFDTWENNSAEYSGNVSAWSPLTADEKLGYVYIPLEAATGDFYGGHRKGNNLYSGSLVCLDARTGKKVWHYQIVHHDIWDYDLPAPPILTDIKVNGKEIKAVVQVTKQAFAYVFDRVTGIPVWPMEEKAVPVSTVPGEFASATQPIPTKPLPFDRQGYHDSILVDFTPEIKKKAIEIASKYQKGPLYSPVSIYNPPISLGTLMLPDAVGGANWQGGVYDKETGMLYVSSSTVLRPMSLEKGSKEMTDMDYVAYLGSSRIGPFGLPLVKPPYGRITAINLHTGDHVWMQANANTPDWVKNIPALKGVSLPRTGLPDRVGMLVTKTLLFAGEGSGLYVSDGGGGKIFRAYDKMTGDIISEMELPANQAGMPMTYSINGKQYIVVAVGAVGHAGELVALSL